MNGSPEGLVKVAVRRRPLLVGTSSDAKNQPIQYNFEIPEQEFFKMIQLKFGIYHDTYRWKALRFWQQIDFKKFTEYSFPSKTVDFADPSDTLFQCFSLILTGENVCTEKIKYYVKKNLHLYEELKTMPFEEGAINFICVVLNCRIGIFEPKKFIKVGNWNEESPCILIQHKDDIYKPILSFK